MEQVLNGNRDLLGTYLFEPNDQDRRLWQQ